MFRISSMIGLVLLIAFKVIAPSFKTNETKFKQTGILSENGLDKTEKESEKDNFEQGKDYYNTCIFMFEHFATDDEQYHLPSYGNHYDDGKLAEVGSIGFDVEQTGNFDINSDGTIAFAALKTAGKTNLYTIDLNSGKASKIANDFSNNIKYYQHRNSNGACCLCC